MRRRLQLAKVKEVDYIGGYSIEGNKRVFSHLSSRSFTISLRSCSIATWRQVLPCCHNVHDKEQKGLHWLKPYWAAPRARINGCTARHDMFPASSWTTRHTIDSLERLLNWILEYHSLCLPPSAGWRLLPATWVWCRESLDCSWNATSSTVNSDRDTTGCTPIKVRVWVQHGGDGLACAFHHKNYNEGWDIWTLLMIINEARGGGRWDKELKMKTQCDPADKM